jgi:hypothetical protein
MNNSELVDDDNDDDDNITRKRVYVYMPWKSSVSILLRKGCWGGGGVAEKLNLRNGRMSSTFKLIISTLYTWHVRGRHKIIK